MSEIIDFSKATIGSCNFMQFKILLQKLQTQDIFTIKGNHIHRSGLNLERKNIALYVLFLLLQYRLQVCKFMQIKIFGKQIFCSRD